MIVGRKTQYKMSVLSNLIYRFNATPVKIPTSYFVNIDKLILKLVWREKRSRMVNTILKNKVGTLTLPDVKTDYSHHSHQESLILAKE